MGCHRGHAATTAPEARPLALPCPVGQCGESPPCLDAKDGCRGALAPTVTDLSDAVIIQVQKWLGDKLKPTVVTSDMKKVRV